MEDLELACLSVRKRIGLVTLAVAKGALQESPRHRDSEAPRVRAQEELDGDQDAAWRCCITLEMLL